VSISRDYQDASRGLIASFLLDRTSHELARLVQPRIKYREAATGAVRKMALVAASIEDLSLPISDIESDRKGVPVLLRQYLKAGGRLLGLNVDPNFRDVVDALILTDLRAPRCASGAWGDSKRSPSLQGRIASRIASCGRVSNRMPLVFPLAG
jgi:hypothetical protein